MIHAVGILAGWLLFLWGWQRVLASHPSFAELRSLLFGAVLVVPVLTLAWIAHNRGIHRRKGPRRAVTPATLRYETDFNGRSVHADWPALAAAQVIRVAIDGPHKRYQVAGRIGGQVADQAVGLDRGTGSA